MWSLWRSLEMELVGGHDSVENYFPIMRRSSQEQEAYINLSLSHPIKCDMT